MTEAHELEDGFYWVRIGRNWCIGVWRSSGFWSVVDVNQSHGVILQPDEIDPRPIKRNGGE